jgi:putative ABC transport system substrate-binding protein
MRRRDLIVGVWAIAMVGNAQAQQSGKVHRIAIVAPSGPVFTSDWWMWDDLRRLGYFEGKNLLIERYSGESHALHYPELAREVVRRNPELIVAYTNEPVLDLKAATSTIPIVGTFGQPVEAGIVQSLARPGGNITGVSVDIGGDQWGKRHQLLQQMLPQATRIALLIPRSIRDPLDAGIREVYRVMGLTLVDPPLDYPIDEAAYRRVFAALVQNGAEGIMVFDTVENWVSRRLIAELAENHRLPAMYPYREYVEAGGLMSYGASGAEFSRRMAIMVDQILKGTKPADIPIYQPSKFELVINLKAAKALGLTIPMELRAVADDEIE